MQFAKSLTSDNSEESNIKDLVGSVVNLAGSVVSTTYSDTFSEKKKENKFKKLEGVHKLQGSIVKQNMHNAMSPISAISGYLELINMSLIEEPDVEQIEYYRKKIESGVYEVNKIIEQLQGIYNQELIAASEANDDMLDVDMNWLISQVCDQMHFSKSDIQMVKKAMPLHVRTDLFISKLIIFNLINYAAKCSCKEGGIDLVTDKENEAATLSILFETSDHKRNELNVIFRNEGNEVASNKVEQNSFNEGLINSIRLAKEIYSTINFMAVPGGSVIMKLTMPLAG